VWSGGDGAGDMRQQVRRGMVLLAIMVVGVLQRGCGAAVKRMEAGHACEGHE
jgi:hypothetical protein